MYFEGGINNLEQEKKTSFFPTHLNRASSLVEREQLCSLIWKHDHVELRSSLCLTETEEARHAGDILKEPWTWLVTTLEGLNFSNVQPKTNEILQKKKQARVQGRERRVNKRNGENRSMKTELGLNLSLTSWESGDEFFSQSM